ncbi:heme A synthase [bacterium]|nr:heme A synthase [bacterium]
MNPQRSAVCTAGLTYFLLLAGGLVHSTDSGLACPDWPLCYGQFFPPMVGKIRFEHGHRLIAAMVGVMTLLTARLIWTGAKPGLRFLAVVAVATVCFQSILGGLTVIYRLPDLVSTAHLAVGTAFFCMLVVLSVRTAAAGCAIEIDGRIRAALFSAALVVYLQMILGAFVRHSGSGLACPEVPHCLAADWIPPLLTPGGIHMLHRFGSILALLATGWVYSLCQNHLPLWKWSTAAFGLTIAQMFIGFFSVWTNLSLWSVMAHLGVAQLILMCLVILLAKTSSRSRATAGVPSMVEA